MPAQKEVVAVVIVTDWDGVIREYPTAVRWFVRDGVILDICSQREDANEKGPNANIIASHYWPGVRRVEMQGAKSNSFTGNQVLPATAGSADRGPARTPQGLRMM